MSADRSVLRRSAVALAVAACALGGLAQPARGALGDLDPTYGQDGISSGAAPLTVTSGHVAGDGSAVVAGRFTDVFGVSRIAVERFSAGGAPGPRSEIPDVASPLGHVAVAPHPDGGVVVAASAGQPSRVHVVRLDAAGGIVWENAVVDGFGSAEDTVADVLVTPDGAVIVTGTRAATTTDLLLARLDGDTGQVDQSFAGGAGYATLPALGGAALARAGSRLVVAVESAGRGIGVARFEPDGTGAIAPPGFTGPAGAEARDAVVRADGRTVVAGGTGSAPLVALFRADLAPDPTFGSGGAAALPPAGAGSGLGGVALDPAGGIWAAGSDGADALLAKVDDRGLADPVLDASGPHPGVRRFDGGGADEALAIGFDALGRAHTAGGSLATTGEAAAIATRHLPNAAPAAAFTAPATVRTGETAVFDASVSSDPERALRRFEWDLDGDGRYETDSGTNPVVSRSYGAAGALTAGLRVTDHAGAQSAAARPLSVQSPPPEQTPAPDLGSSAVVEPVRGIVRVRLPGSRRFVPIGSVTEIPNGSEIDARRGRVLLTVQRDASGATDSARFYAGRFIFAQGAGPRPYTTLTLAGGDFRGCGPANPKLRIPLATAARKRKGRRGRRRVVRRLWGDGKGRFRTKGRYAAATVRGTRWQTVDRCDGVLLVVRRGVVDFRDLLRGTPSRRVAAGRRSFVPSKQERERRRRAARRRGGGR